MNKEPNKNTWSNYLNLPLKIKKHTMKCSNAIFLVADNEKSHRLDIYRRIIKGAEIMDPEDMGFLINNLNEDIDTITPADLILMGYYLGITKGQKHKPK